MKIVNLNEYSEGEGLKNKLRQRIDNFEPELSDSLWDRIHHEMDQKETQRKKRFLWWFSSVAVVVLASGIVTFTLVNNNEQPQMAQQPAVISSPAPAQSEAGNTQVPQETAAPATTDVATPAPITYDATTSNGTGNGRNNGRNNGNSTPRNTTPAAENSPAVVPATTEDRPTAEAAPVETQQEPLAPENTQAPIVDDNNSTIEEPTTPAAETEEKLEEKDTEKSKGNTTDKDAKAKYNKWFIGAVYGYAQNNRTATDVNPSYVWATAADRNKYEYSGIATTYGIQMGYMVSKNVFIKSGVNIYNTTEIVKYDIHRRKVLQGGQPDDPIYGNKVDSVAVGTTTAHQNSYNYIQIPLEVGFMQDINKYWGYNVSAGAAYNILNNYNYYLYEPQFGNAFIPSSSSNTNYFQNYVMVSGNAGLHYNISKNWRALAGFNYRRAVTSSATKETRVDVRPWSIGGNVALAFSF